MTKKISRTFDEYIVSNASPQNQAVTAFASKVPEVLTSLYHFNQVHNTQASKAGRATVMSGSTERFAYATSGAVTLLKAVNSLRSTYKPGDVSKTDGEVLGQRFLATPALAAGALALIENTTNFTLEDVFGKTLSNVIRGTASTAIASGAFYGAPQNLSVAKSSPKKN